MKEFNLSELECNEGKKHRDSVYHIKDVKEFIKRLKDGCGKKFNECVNKHGVDLFDVCGSSVDTDERYYQIRCNRCLEFEKKIEKLAGEKLK